MTNSQVKKVIAYVRVSTSEQGKSGLGLEAQRAAIISAAHERGWEIVDWKQDIQTGTSTRKRPNLAQAIADTQAGLADAIVSSSITRPARNVVDYLGMVDKGIKEGWLLIALDAPYDVTTPDGRFMLTIYCAVAEKEAADISKRTKDALQAKKARGDRLGRPVLLPQEIRDRIEMMYESGEGFTSIARFLNNEGVPTATGSGPWYPAGVRQVLKSLERDREQIEILSRA